MKALFGCGLLAWDRLKAWLIRSYWLRRVASAGRGVVLGEGVRLYGPDRIHLEDEVIVGNYVILRALTEYPWTNPPQRFSPELILRRGCFINNYTQIACARRIEIGENTMIAEHCFIADHQHGYEDPERSIKAQPLTEPGEIVIGPDGWVGVGSVIVGSVRIGRHCVVGAHSVVLSDVPDFTVVAGAPARPIKRFDPNQKRWRRVSPEGAFVECGG